MRSASVIISGMSLVISRIAVPASREVAQQFVQIGLGLDVDADRGLVDDQDAHAGREPFGDADLLLVAARKVADELASEGVRTSSLRMNGSTAALTRPVERCSRARLASLRQIVIAGVVQHGVHQDQPLLLAVLADIADAVAVDRVGTSRSRGLAVDQDLRRRRRDRGR